MSNWKEKALQMKLDGYSSRHIGKVLGKGKSTINDLIKRFRDGNEDIPQIVPNVQGPKILFFDIETAPILGHVWRLFDQNVGLNQIESDWYMMSFCAKWAHSDEVYYFDQRGQVDIEDDYNLLLELWKLLNEADIVVGHNSKRFDVKKANSRFILNGLPKPSTYRQIDTVEIAKRQFGFTSNKLEYLTDKLCVENKKLKHAKFPGHVLWSECMKGNMEAWDEMKEYNIADVLSLEELYNVLSSWDNSLPNLDVYVDEILDMDEWEDDGFHYTNLGKYKKYRNKITGQQKRSRVNLLSKEKRDSLLSNV